jgi:hypothetical protein
VFIPTDLQSLGSEIDYSSPRNPATSSDLHVGKPTGVHEFVDSGSTNRKKFGRLGHSHQTVAY